MSENYLGIMMRIISGNYEWELSSENYDLEYQSRRKVEIYRDTGVSKKISKEKLIFK